MKYISSKACFITSLIQNLMELKCGSKKLLVSTETCSNFSSVPNKKINKYSQMI